MIAAAVAEVVGIRKWGNLRLVEDPKQATIILVTCADQRAIREVARTSGELDALSLANPFLAVNGRFHATDPTDVVAAVLECGRTVEWLGRLASILVRIASLIGAE